MEREEEIATVTVETYSVWLGRALLWWMITSRAYGIDRYIRRRVYQLIKDTLQKDTQQIRVFGVDLARETQKRLCVNCNDKPPGFSDRLWSWADFFAPEATSPKLRIPLSMPSYTTTCRGCYALALVGENVCIFDTHNSTMRSRHMVCGCGIAKTSFGYLKRTQCSATCLALDDPGFSFAQ